MWEKTVAENPDKTVLEWASSFFESTESLVREQLTWFKLVFHPAYDSPAGENLVQALLEVHSSMEPKFDFCLDASIKQQGEPIAYLAQVRGKTVPLAP